MSLYSVPRRETYPCLSTTALWERLCLCLRMNVELIGSVALSGQRIPENQKPLARQWQLHFRLSDDKSTLSGSNTGASAWLLLTFQTEPIRTVVKNTSRLSPGQSGEWSPAFARVTCREPSRPSFAPRELCNLVRKARRGAGKKRK